MDAWIVLGCHGHRWYGLSLCRGTSNQIADLSRLGPDHEEIMNHLDNHYKIFDKVIEDLNVIGNAINYLNKYRLIPDHLMKIIHSYIAMHKHCGLYMFVDPKTARTQ